MTKLIVAIVFGGQSPEHKESIRATRAMYREAIQGKLDHKYHFEYFYLSDENNWATKEDSKFLLLKKIRKAVHYSKKRILELHQVDAIYNTMMGPCGENGNIMGLADLFNIPMIGCGITASAVTADKKLTKMAVESLHIPVVESICARRNHNISKIVKAVDETIGYPCFVKPTNLGTCAFVFRANDQIEFIQKWSEVVCLNNFSSTYLIEKFVPNLEVRVFVFEDLKNKLHFNDEYATTLREKALEQGGGLFDHHPNELPSGVRKRIQEYSEKIFRAFEMKDYARIDFFVTSDYKIYFNEVNTQPFIGSYNIELLEKDGYSFAKFFQMLIQRNCD